MKHETHIHVHTSAASALLVEEMKAALFRLETRMAALDDKLNATLAKIAELKVHVSTETQQVKDTVASFQDNIDTLTADRDRLQALVDAGNPTPEQLAKLEEVNEALDELAISVDRVDPSTPTTVSET